MNLQLLQQVPLFHTLPEEELMRLAPALVAREYAAGEILFLESEAGDRLTIITEGEVEIIKALDTPDERILAVLGPGEIIGEMSLVFKNHQRSASARACKDTQVLEMTQKDFNDLLDRSAHLSYGIMQDMSERLRRSEEATIRDLREKNYQLTNAYVMLKEAQEQLIHQEMMEHELKMARKIQQNYLPKELPDIPGWRLAALWQPARQVSGDFYDFIYFSGGRLGVVIGDVTGKGVPAALVMATTRSVLRAVALNAAQEGCISPGEILVKTNNALCPDMPQMMFVTCMFGVLDPETGQVCIANAGHPLPLLRTSKEVMHPRVAGMPLGLIPDMNYDEIEIRLDCGDNLFLYSDGLVEAHNTQGEMFSSERLLKLLEGRESGKELITMLMGQLSDFTGVNNEQEDDVTLVCLDRI
jgi:serine phosphatase RsbU (regulator of sigma subunit)